MKLLDYINDNTNNAYKDFKLVSVIFEKSTRTCTFKFLYKDEMKENDKDILYNLISNYFNNKLNIVIKCKKAYINEDLVSDVIFNFISRNFASLSAGFRKDDINVAITDTIKVLISAREFEYNYLTTPKIRNEIESYATSFFFEPFELDFCKIDDTITESLIDKIPEFMIFDDSSQSKYKYTKIANMKKFIGEVSGNPITISSVNGPIESVEIAGTISFFNEKSFEKKDKNDNVTNRIFYSFNLGDSSGKLNCVYFPNKADLEKVKQLKDGDIIVVHGDIQDYNARLSMKIKGISFCEIIEDNNDNLHVKFVTEPKENYICVKPEKYVDIKQDNLFSQGEEIGDYLLNHDVVVFDIETTGLEATKCEILEIGAVKIQKGIITETFETLIKPTSKIPDEITELTGITDSMVINSPSIKRVLPDFYKFCFGTTIIAYNIDFDYKFINIQGRKLGYLFDMKQIDAMYLARAYIPGLKNFKLGTVCKKLGVSLENAHRAVHDALATAEVVIKLNKNIT